MVYLSVTTQQFYKNEYMNSYRIYDKYLQKDLICTYKL